MTIAAIRNKETGEIVGSITDTSWNHQTEDFRKHVEDILAPDGKVSTITTTSFNPSEGSLSDGSVPREEGDMKFGRTLIENLGYPYFLASPEKRLKFEI